MTEPEVSKTTPENLPVAWPYSLGEAQKHTNRMKPQLNFLIAPPDTSPLPQTQNRSLMDREACGNEVGTGLGQSPDLEQVFCLWKLCSWRIEILRRGTLRIHGFRKREGMWSSRSNWTSSKEAAMPNQPGTVAGS